MASKSWLETRGRFLIGLAAVCMLCIALISWQGSLRSRLELGSPQLDAVSAASRMAYATYVHRFLQSGALQPLTQLLAILLAIGGLQRERETGTAALTLSLLLTRRDLVGIRAAVGVLQIALLALMPGLLIPAVSWIVGEFYPVPQALGFSLLSFATGVTIFSGALLVSTFLGGQLTAMLVAWLLLWLHTAVALLPTLRPWRLSLTWIASGAGMSYFNPETSFLIGVPWLHVSVLAVISAALVAAAARVTENQDY